MNTLSKGHIIITIDTELFVFQEMLMSTKMKGEKRKSVWKWLKLILSSAERND